MKTTNKLTTIERQAILSLSSILSLRMIGLFMVLPVFTIYAHNLNGATPTLIGLALGIYGLFQAVCQIPFGALSDKIGRKPIILAGLLLFCLGSLIAGCAHSIIWMIIGRSLQGAGAIGSTTLALIADLTREEQRTKSMAIAGITIGLSFSIAMLAGPLLTKWMPVNNLFFLATGFGLIAILILFLTVPQPKRESWHAEAEPERRGFITLLTDRALITLNAGIFILHAVFTASFIVIPISLYSEANLAASKQWEIFFPSLMIALFLSLAGIGIAERKQLIKPFFILSILFLLVSEIILWAAPAQLTLALIALTLFFTGFTLLESFLPSLVSRTAPVRKKGSAMGLYSCAQFLGIFTGGVLGGYLYGTLHFSGVYLFSVSLLILWLIIVSFSRKNHYNRN